MKRLLALLAIIALAQAAHAQYTNTFTINPGSTADVKVTHKASSKAVWLAKLAGVNLSAYDPITCGIKADKTDNTFYALSTGTVVSASAGTVLFEFPATAFVTNLSAEATMYADIRLDGYDVPLPSLEVTLKPSYNWGTETYISPANHEYQTNSVGVGTARVINFSSDFTATKSGQTLTIGVGALEAPEWSTITGIPPAITNYAENMDQGVASTNTPDFAGLTIDGVQVATGTPLYVESDPVYSANPYATAMDQNVSSAGTPEFASVTINGIAVVPGPGDHNTLSNLAWTSGGHTGTPARLAGFFEGGAAGYAGFGAGMYLDGDDNIAISNAVLAGASAGATAVQTESDPVASSNLTVHINTTGAEDAHGLSNTVVLAAGALQRTGGDMTGNLGLGGNIITNVGAIYPDTNVLYLNAERGFRMTTVADDMGFVFDDRYGMRFSAGGTNIFTVDHDDRVISISVGDFALPNGAAINEFSTDGTMAGNSDSAVPTEKAVVTYAGDAVSFEEYCSTHATLTPGATVTVPGTAAQYSLTVTNSWTLALAEDHPRWGFVIEVTGTNSMSYPAPWHTVDTNYVAGAKNYVVVGPYATTNFSLDAFQITE